MADPITTNNFVDLFAKAFNEVATPGLDKVTEDLEKLETKMVKVEDRLEKIEDRLDNIEENMATKDNLEDLKNIIEKRLESQYAAV